ncbi:HNH endonuclease [Altericroceibacterium spongiae]
MIVGQNIGIQRYDWFRHLTPLDNAGGLRPQLQGVNSRMRRGYTPFFRRAVLTNFNSRCCVTGISESKLLIASHISPWAADILNRHNPRNGLCLSATFDRAFDAYLMTVTPDLKIKFSNKIINSKSKETREFFKKYEGKSILNPTHISLDSHLLEIHSDKLIN